MSRGPAHFGPALIDGEAEPTWRQSGYLGAERDAAAPVAGEERRAQDHSYPDHKDHHDDDYLWPAYVHVHVYHES